MSVFLILVLTTVWKAYNLSSSGVTAPWKLSRGQQWTNKKSKIVAVSGRTDAAGGEEWPEKEQEDEQKRWGKKKPLFDINFCDTRSLCTVQFNEGESNWVMWPGQMCVLVHACVSTAGSVSWEQMVLCQLLVFWGFFSSFFFTNYNKIFSALFSHHPTLPLGQR